jgi:hypothetical protein
MPRRPRSPSSLSSRPRSMSGRSSSADEEVAGTTYSASGSDDAQASQLPDRQRRRLPIVDSHNLGRVLRQAEIQVGDSPGFFFAAMPTPRMPKSAEKVKHPSTASARKTRAIKSLIREDLD